MPKLAAGGLLAVLVSVLGVADTANADVLSEVSVSADYPEDAHTTWLNNGYSLEDPYVFDDHTSFGKHVVTMNGGGPQGQDVFRFHIHPPDLDKGGGTRSRNEIKAVNSSPASLKFTSGDIGRFHWYFKLPSDYEIAGDDILFQLHATGGGNDPIIKLQLHVDAAEVTHDPNNCNCDSEETLDSVPLSLVAGQWIEAELVVVFHDSTGYMNFEFKDPQGNVVMSAERSNIDTMLHSFLRPKAGIYRKRGSGKSDFMDLADFSVQKHSEIPPIGGAGGDATDPSVSITSATDRAVVGGTLRVTRRPQIESW